MFVVFSKLWTLIFDLTGYFTLFISFDCYFLLHEISGLHLHHYGYDFYVNSTRYCGWKASSSLLPRSTHDLSYISKLYPFRVFGLLQFPEVHHKPRVERVFRIYAVASMISALVTLLYASVLRFVAPP